MSQAKPKRVAVIFNPAAGRRHGMRFQATVERLEGQVTLYRTTRPGDATEMALNMVGDGVDIVVAAGGGSGRSGFGSNGLPGAACASANTMTATTKSVGKRSRTRRTTYVNIAERPLSRGGG